MTPRLRSRKNRPIHMGAYPTEKLRRAEGVAGPVPAFTPLGVTGDARPLAQATRDHTMGCIFRLTMNRFVSPSAKHVL